MPRTLAATLAALTAVGLTGCAGVGTAATSSGDPAACPGELLDVVVSVAQWGDLARSLAGACADVTTIVASGAVDPHDFEPGTSDLAALSRADLVVLNGGHYDEWASAAVETLDPRPTVVSAADVAGEHGDEPHGDEHGDDEHGDDPHLWYSPETVQDLSAAVTEALTQLSPRAADYFAGRAAAWRAELQPYVDTVAELRAVAEGRTYAATETVFDRMAAAVGMRDVTPQGYRQAVSNESEPSPVDLARFEMLLRDGGADVLVVNRQTSGGLVDRLVEVAKDSTSVPIVGVTESPPEAGGSFVEWQTAQLRALRAALGGAR